MGLSRVTVGVHSFNQVIMGWLLGIWMALFCTFFCRSTIKNHVKALLTGENKKPISHYAKILLLIFLVMLTTFASLFTFVSADIHQMRISDQLVQNIKQVCQDRFSPEESFHVVGLKDVAFSMMFFGACAGFLLQIYFFQGQRGIMRSQKYNATCNWAARFTLIMIITTIFAPIVDIQSNSLPIQILLPKRAVGICCWMLILTFSFD